MSFLLYLPFRKGSGEVGRFVTLLDHHDHGIFNTPDVPQKHLKSSKTSLAWLTAELDNFT